MSDARDLVTVLYVVGGVATAAALVISVVSIALSVRVAARRPEVAEDLNERYQARRAELRDGLDERQRLVAVEGNADEIQRVRAESAVAEEQAQQEFAAEFSRHGMVPTTYENVTKQHYMESAWQVQQSLRPQVVGAVLLVVGIGLQTWASIWALSLPAVS